MFLCYNSIFFNLIILWKFYSIDSAVAPKIKPFYFSKSVHEGQREQVICSAITGDLPLTFIWKKDGVTVENFHDITLVSNDLFSVLVIASIKAENVGNYTCILKNAFGSDTYTASLVMKGSTIPKIIPFHFMSTVQEGERQQVMCSVVAGDPPFTFTWKKDGAEISKSIKIKMDELYSVLIIPFVRSEDIGNYSCIVQNEAGIDQYTAALYMKVYIAVASGVPVSYTRKSLLLEDFKTITYFDLYS
ncbi:follistatin-related protein 4-like isoform X1 [Centruroides vittatus]|uniref:follistatin-related protein 4-like isoform X1 n=1 Tax=Centruroides vittatus TaxID=120091 RepID=UPI00350EAF3D